MDWTALRRNLIASYRAPELPRWLTIPAFPTSVTQFAKKADDPESSAAELGRIIEADNGLTSELLRQVNNSVISLRHKAATAQHAISILGFHRWKHAVAHHSAREGKILVRCRADLCRLEFSGGPDLLHSVAPCTDAEAVETRVKRFGGRGCETCRLSSRLFWSGTRRCEHTTADREALSQHGSQRNVWRG